MSQRLRCVKCGESDMLHKMRKHDDDFNELYILCRCGMAYGLPYLVPRQAIPKRVLPEYLMRSQSEPMGIEDDPLWDAVKEVINK